MPATLLAAVLFAGIAPGLQARAQAPALSVPTRSAIVDADLSEWPAAGAAGSVAIDASMVADATDVEGDADLSVVAHVARDDTNLYLAARVRDDATVFERWGNRLHETDALEFWLGANQFAVALVEGRPVLHQYPFSGTPADLDGSEVAFAYTSDGYALEVALPLAALAAAGVDVDAADGFPFAVGADDADVRGGERIGQVYYPLGWVWNDTATYATATAEEAR